METLSWKLIDSFFKNNENTLVDHHIQSYNSFFDKEIYNIFKEKNPIKIYKAKDPATKIFKHKCELFMGGLDGTQLYYGKPIIYDDTKNHIMYPNEARLRNMSYSFSIHYDVLVRFTILDEQGEAVVQEKTYEKMYLGRFPIMVQSNMCILNSLPKEIRFNMGECRNDYGGYFIIDGKEKAIIPQEKFADNMLYIKQNNDDDLYSHSAEIRSVSEDTSKPQRTLSVRIVAPIPTNNNGNIVVNVPNVRKPVPLFILMRALGVVSDKDIIECCLLDMNKYKKYKELFVPSVYDAGPIYNQKDAIKYISSLTKNKSIAHAHEILMDYFLPHIGELNFKAKALYLGYIVLNLLKVYTMDEEPTDRDSFKFKRVEVTGSLIKGLFNEYYNLQVKNLYTRIDKEYYYHAIYKEEFTALIENNVADFFKERIVEDGFKKAFKGNWGSQEHTKRPGVIQSLNRLSYNSFLSHLRKINLPLDASAKIIKPRLLHPTQWGIIDPLDTPDGGNVGLHKHLALSTTITSGYSSKTLIELLMTLNIKLIEECTLKVMDYYTKLFINGAWLAMVFAPDDFVIYLRLLRRNALIPIHTSILWDITKNEIYISTDSGRLCRPIIYLENGKPSVYRENIQTFIDPKENINWNQVTCGFSKKKNYASGYRF